MIAIRTVSQDIPINAGKKLESQLQAILQVSDGQIEYEYYLIKTAL